MSGKINVGDIINLTGEGLNYIKYSYFDDISENAKGMILKTYPYEDGDEESNGQPVYDILIAGLVVKSLFGTEIFIANE
tara:strand:- start:338 stop:574 length:237 start_codon:yes stop_codon:yes gene_type:complete